MRDVMATTSPVQVRDETQELTHRYGCSGVLGILGRMLILYVRSVSYRQFVRGVCAMGVTPPGLGEYLGYGMYVGQK